MKKHHLKLESLYQDLCQRYGAEDTAVIALREEIDSLKAKLSAPQSADRRIRLHHGHIWDRENWKKASPSRQLH